MKRNDPCLLRCIMELRVNLCVITGLLNTFLNPDDSIAQSPFAVKRARDSRTIARFDWINQEFLQVPFSGPTSGVNCIGANEAEEKSGAEADVPPQHLLPAQKKKKKKWERKRKMRVCGWMHTRTNGHTHSHEKCDGMCV